MTICAAPSMRRLFTLLTFAMVRAGKLLDPETPLSLALDGMTTLHGALSAEELSILNAYVDRALGQMEQNMQALSHSVTAQIDSMRQQGLFLCLGDVVQRGVGKYEIRVPELDLYPRDQPEGSGQLPPFLVYSPAWWPEVTAALGSDAELRSATVILSTSAELVTGNIEAPRSVLLQGATAWHSDGARPPAEHAGVTYALVVYIPLVEVAEDAGRVEYLPRTHTAEAATNGLRVGRSTNWRSVEPWTPEWKADVIVPPMRAGDAVVYTYTTQHRGLPSTAAGYRPVLKLDYFRPGVGTKQVGTKQARSKKDGWCEASGFLLDASPDPRLSSGDGPASATRGESAATFGGATAAAMVLAFLAVVALIVSRFVPRGAGRKKKRR